MAPAIRPYETFSDDELHRLAASADRRIREMDRLASAFLESETATATPDCTGMSRPDLVRSKQEYAAELAAREVEKAAAIPPVGPKDSRP